jgi:hypothetical protein
MKQCETCGLALPMGATHAVIEDCLEDFTTRLAASRIALEGAKAYFNSDAIVDSYDTHYAVVWALDVIVGHESINQ